MSSGNKKKHIVFLTKLSEYILFIRGCNGLLVRKCLVHKKPERGGGDPSCSNKLVPTTPANDWS